jgi:hypothetical protein
MLLITILFSKVTFAQIQLLKKDNPKDSFNQVQNSQKIVKKLIPKNDPRDKLLKESNDKIDKMMSLLDKIQPEKKLIIKESKHKVMALSKFRGRAETAIIATNIQKRQFEVTLSNNPDFDGVAKLRCFSMAFQKRIMANCNLLVVEDEEWPVTVRIVDLDGQDLVPDEWYDSREKEFIAGAFSSFLAGAARASRSTYETAFGNAPDINAKNQVLGGILGISDNINKNIEKEMQEKIEIGFINTGRPIIAVFDETLKMSEANKTM